MQAELGQKVVAEITSAGGSAVFLALDVTDAAAWDAAIAGTLETYGALDVLINNAGIGDNAFIEDTSIETYNKVVAVTQTSVFLGMKAASAALKNGGGSVVQHLVDLRHLGRLRRLACLPRRQGRRADPEQEHCSRLGQGGCPGSTRCTPVSSTRPSSVTPLAMA